MTQGPTPGPLSGEQISALVQEQMHDCWYEICADTGCHPLDIVQLGRKRLEYKPGHWTRFVGDAVAARLAPLAQIGETPCLNSSCSSLSSSDGAGKSGAGSSPTAPVEASGSERDEVEDVADTLRSVSNDLMNAGAKWAPHANDLYRAALRLEALSTIPARAEAQDEGAAGEKNLGWFAGFARKHGHHAQADWLDQYARAHPSPTPAADADRVREALSEVRDWLALLAIASVDDVMQGATAMFDLCDAALKSTAAKEGGEA